MWPGGKFAKHFNGGRGVRGKFRNLQSTSRFNGGRGVRAKKEKLKLHTYSGVRALALFSCWLLAENSGFGAGFGGPVVVDCRAMAHGGNNHQGDFIEFVCKPARRAGAREAKVIFVAPRGKGYR